MPRTNKDRRQLPIDRRAPLDYAGAAAYLGVTERWLRDKVQARRIPHRKLGRLVRFVPKELDAFLDSAAVPTEPEHPLLPRRSA